MKINMAEADYFDPGMIVSCTTCHGQNLQGEVMAFDSKTRMLVLKSNAASGKPNLHDVRFLNLNLVSDISVLREMTEEPAPLSQLNFSKLTSRVKQSLEDKRTKVNYINKSVPPHAQELFLAITKTISHVEWDGQDIIVMSQVCISPPYRSENCKALKNDGHCALNHITKIVDKHHRDLAEGNKGPSPPSS